MIILLKAIYAVSMPDANLIKLYQDANTGEAILAGFLPQLYMGAGIVDWSASVTEWKKDKAGLLKKIAYWERAFGQLLPSEVTSPQGGTLSIEWSRNQGQFLLKKISSDGNVILSSTYSAPSSDTSTVEISVWPKTDEAYTVRLELSSYALTGLTRIEKNLKVSQKLKYGYCADPTLDRVLNRIEEEDGSIELVTYREGGMPFPYYRQPPLPCVTLHSLFPGACQSNITDHYFYSGTNYLGFSEPPDAHQNRLYYERLELRELVDDEGYYVQILRQNPDHIVSTRHAFNKNHLQVREDLQVQFQAEKVISWEFANASPGEKVFGLPTKITTDYTDLSHPNTERTTTVQTLAYNNIGQLTKSIAVDGVVTEWLYYPDTGGQGLDISLIAEKPLSKDLVTLTCPKVSEGYMPPVKVEYVHDPAYPKSQQITAYAYQARENPVNQRSVLVPSTVVVLTGVTLDTTTMLPSLMEGRKNALIEQRVISRSIPDVATENTTAWKESVVQNSWLGMQRNTLTTSMLYDDNPSVGRTVRAEAQGKIISSRIFSRLSGRPLSETRDGLEFRYVHDSLGRLVRQERGTTEAGAWKADAVETTDYSITAEGLQVTVTEAEQQVRTLYDGLQRPVWVAIKRTILPDSAFCVISRIEYDGPDATNQTLYDYLPGGLRRTKDARPEAAVDASKLAWMADYTREDAGILINEQVIGADSGAQLIRQLSGRNLDKSHTALLETLRPSTARDASTDRTIERTFDDERRLIKIRTSNTSEHCIEYDELERAVAIIAPDGTRTERKYHQLSDYITQLNVGSTVLGTQKMTAAARQTTVGELTYEFPGGSASTVVRPDKTLLESAVSADGHTATLSINKKVHTQRVISQPNVLTVTVDPVSVPSAEAWSSLTSSPQSLGLTSITQTSPRGSRQAEMTRSLKGRLLTNTAVDGRQMRVFRDYLDRVVRVILGELHYHYLWSAFGEPLQRTVVNQASGERLDVRFTWDAFGQEIAREYTLNNKPLLALTNSYLANGQVSSKTLTREGVLQRTEGFSYDARDRLNSYECTTDVADWPQDQAGKSLSKQSYGYDELHNLSECSSTYADGSTCIQTYTYDTVKNPTRRLSVKTELRSGSQTTSTQTATLAYDANGNQTTDESGRTLAYTPLGQLASVKDNDGKLLTRYSYDAFGRLISQYIGATKHTCELLYDGTQLTGEAWFDDANREFKRILFSEDMVQQTCIGETVRSDFVLTDPGSGVVGFSAHDGTAGVKLHPLGYTPYGESTNLDSGCRLGFNSERIDPVLGWYHLGNGYRTYSPAQRHWLQPDSWSPFGAGGINNTAYCAGDPVNLFDPSGHVMISRWGASNMISDLTKALQETSPQPLGHFWRGLAVNASVAVAGVLMVPLTGGSSLGFAAGVLATTLAVASAGLDIASYVLEDVNPELARKLGTAATALGFISNAPFRAGLRLGGRLLRWTSSRTGRLISRVESIFTKGPKLKLLTGTIKVLKPGMSSYGASNVTRWAPGKLDKFEKLENALFMTVDKQGKRVTFMAHGVKPDDVGDAAMMAIEEYSGSGPYSGKSFSAYSFFDFLKSKKVDLNKYEKVRLIMCHSADGGEKSFAATFSKLTNKPVKGYEGVVDTRFGMEDSMDAFRGVRGPDQIKVVQEQLKSTPQETIKKVISNEPGFSKEGLK